MSDTTDGAGGVERRGEGPAGRRREPGRPTPRAEAAGPAEAELLAEVAVPAEAELLAEVAVPAGAELLAEVAMPAGAELLAETVGPAVAAGVGGARAAAGRRIGIRELRQHASVYVDLAEKGYTVDITNRGRLVAQLVPVREPDSPLERLIAAGLIEPAEEAGGAAGIDPYPARRGPR